MDLQHICMNHHIIDIFTKALGTTCIKHTKVQYHCSHEQIVGDMDLQHI